ncbi:hypothetical protein BsWGS_23828 [Bradybaena similaris]
MSQQSQCGFLEEVLTWDQQMCLENLDNALPRIISKMAESAYIEEGIGILKILCQSFVPCVPTEELEDRVFSQVCKLIQGLIDGAISKITLVIKGALQDTADEVKSTVVECLEWIKDTVSCVECCIRHILSTPGTVELSCVQSLPFCAVRVLREAYAHCKDSTSLYGDLLDHMGDFLADLFKRTHSLQVSLVNLLDKIGITGAQLECHVQVLCSVCSGLFEICGIVTSLDVKLVIGLWKAIVKVCSQHIRLLRDRFDACPLINSLCEEIRQGYKYLFELSPAADALSLSQGDDKAFSKSCKILAFQMKVVLVLLRDFSDYLGNCERNVLDLLLFLHRYMPPSLFAKELPIKLESEVRVQVLNATTPILGHLVQSRVFRAALTCAEEKAREDRLPRLLMQLMLLDMLPKCEADVFEFWLSPINHNSSTPTRGLLSAIFDSIQECEVEMRIPVMLPGVMVAGNAQRQVSLYEYTTTHLCGFIGACSAKHFTVLEYTLLENVLRDGGLSYLVAVDCWCFLVRYGTAVTCRDQVQTLIKAFKQLKDTNQECTDRLRWLVQRLIKFMSPDHQSALVKHFPLSDEPSLWVSLGTSCLNDNLAVSVRQRLLLWGMSVLQAPSAKALEVLQVCQQFADLLKDCPVSDCMSPQQQLVLVSNICNVWSAVQSTAQMPGSVREQLTVRLLHVTSYLLPGLETGDALRVLAIVQSSIKEVLNSDVALAAAHFLMAFGNVRISPQSQRSQILNRLPQLFNSLMSHPDPLVQHRALQVFVQFAQQTVYAETIEACLQANEALHNRVGHFQNRVPYQSSQKEFVLVDYLTSQLSKAALEETVAAANVDRNTGEVCVKEDKERNTLKSQNATVDLAATKCDPSPSEHPAKRARLSTTSSAITEQLNVEGVCASVVPATTVESTGPDKHSKFLETLATLARDMELEFRHTGPPPPSFVEAVKETLSVIRSCLSPDSNWFDSLS